jgi:uncharacterized delta-60 repeat protein
MKAGIGIRGLTLIAAVVATAMALPGVASGAAKLDPTFGNQGMLITTFASQKAGSGVAARLDMARGADGTLVVASNQSLVEHGPNGRLNRDFGNGGRVVLAQQAESQFQLAEAAIDSRGRVLLAGMTKPRPAQSMVDSNVHGPVPSSATVMRFRADGSPDPSFGRGGSVTSDFGFPKPYTDGSWTGTYTGLSPMNPTGFFFPASAVNVTGLAVDSKDRPMLTGGFVKDVIYCPYYGGHDSSEVAFAVRLTKAGGLDPSFGAAGVITIDDMSSLRTPSALSPAGFLATARGKVACSRGPDRSDFAVRLTDDGSPEMGFGGQGLWKADYEEEVVDLAVAPSGKLVLLTVGSVYGSLQRVIRLQPNGSFDVGFGESGSRTLRQPKYVSAIAVDAQERVLLAGSAGMRKDKSKSKFRLSRMTADGRVDHRFGRRGSVTTAFGPRSSGGASQVIVDGGGRILVGGSISSPSLPTGGGFAIARYLGGR